MNGAVEAANKNIKKIIQKIKNDIYKAKKKTTSMTIRMLPTPRFVTYNWLANVASCDP